MQTVEQRHTEAARELADYAGFRFAADHLDMAISATAEAFARFEASLPPSAPVDASALARIIAPGSWQAYDRFIDPAAQPKTQLFVMIYRQGLTTPEQWIKWWAEDAVPPHIDYHIGEWRESLRKADAILSALALPPSGIAEMVREMCAKAAEGRRDSYVEPTDWDYGAQDACFSIASAIRSLDLSNKGVG